MLKRYPNLYYLLAVLLVPLTFILHNVSFYRSLLLYKECYLLFFLYIAFPLTLFLLVQKLFRQKQSLAILVLMLLCILFFFFGAFQDFLLSHPLTKPIGKTYILPFLFLLPIIYLFFRRPATAGMVKGLSIAIFFFFLGEAGLFLWRLKSFDETPKLIKQPALDIGQPGNSDSMNVFHIILDGYTNSRTMQQLFGFNNPLDSFLVQNGFYVASRSKSNYNFTPYSFSSMLNLAYLQLSNEHMERNYKNFYLSLDCYRHNSVFRFFSDRGYQVNHFSLLDDYEWLEKLGTFAPRTPAYSIRNQTIERIFLNPWLWQKIKCKEEQLPPEIRKNLKSYAEYNKHAFDLLVNSPSKQQRQVYFVHFFLPHEPYVFSKRVIDSLTLDDLSNRTGYVQQARYANVLIRSLVEVLQRDSHNIIIIQGDHGFRDYDPAKYPPLMQNEAFNAFYFPDRNYTKLYDSISLVNTYRLILDQYFHQQLPLLKDEYFIAR